METPEKRNTSSFMVDFTLLVLGMGHPEVVTKALAEVVVVSRSIAGLLLTCKNFISCCKTNKKQMFANAIEGKRFQKFTPTYPWIKQKQKHTRHLNNRAENFPKSLHGDKTTTPFFLVAFCSPIRLPEGFSPSLLKTPW